eukprot:jgi/Psemu1/321099/estExt_fgenesh1_pm.C_12740003
MYNVLAVGHSSTGKSTALGHLIYRAGGINHETIEEIDHNYAWVSDRATEERERGASMCPHTLNMESTEFKYNMIDVPGNRDFIESMISSTSLADVALLFVDASKEDDEPGFDEDEHALIAYTLGVKQMIVVVSKMDDETVNFSEDRWKTIRSRVLPYLQKVGYNPMKVAVIPISGLRGDNLIEKSDCMRWYDGPTLLGALDRLMRGRKPNLRPLRVPIHDVRYEAGKGTIVDGFIGTGCVQSNEIQIAPSGIKGTIRSLEEWCVDIPYSEAGAGKIVSIILDGKLDQIFPGQVLSDRTSPAQEASSFEAQIIVINHPGEISEGYTPIIDIHAAHTPCTVISIKNKMDRRTGKIIEENPNSVEEGYACVVELQPQKPLCVEPFRDFSPLGRFLVRDLGRIVAFGVIKSVKKK